MLTNDYQYCFTYNLLQDSLLQLSVVRSLKLSNDATSSRQPQHELIIYYVQSSVTCLNACFEMSVCNQRRPQKFFQGGASDVSIIYWIE